MVYFRYSLLDSFAICIYSYPGSQGGYGMGKGQHNEILKHLAYHASISNTKNN